MAGGRLVCANCAGPVAEGRCGVCRANRARMEQDNPWASLSPSTLIALLVGLLALVVVVHQAATA